MEIIIDPEYVSKNISTFVKRLEQKIKELERIKVRLLLSKGNAVELDRIIRDICSEFWNCETCPLAGRCSIMLGVLCKVISCDKCPRLHVCLGWGLLELRRRRRLESLDKEVRDICADSGDDKFDRYLDSVGL